MQAAIYRRTGPAADVLRIEERPVPSPEPGEVLVRISTSGINPADVKRRAGWNGLSMSHAEVVPHCDGAGLIVQVGDGVDQSRIGERVWLWNAQGGYGEVGRAFGTAAQFIAIEADQAVLLDDAMSFEEGACLGVPAMTAWWAVHADGPVEGKTILVQGAAGAVGNCAAQIARAGGARVIGTISSDTAADHVHSTGMIDLINRNRQNVAEAVGKLTAHQGVDRIIEVDLAANMEINAALIAPHGTIASYSSSSDPKPTLDYYAFANLGANLRFIQGFRIPAQARARGQKSLATLAASKKLNIPIGQTFDLADIAAAHERVEAGSIGNVVLRVSGQ
ncbi:MAG: NADPH:quinone reductase [Stappiaceae bacterium]